MSDTNFIDYITPVPATWLNDVNDHVYNGTPVSPATTVHDASVIANTPAGTIVATTVQTAINELDTEKATLAGSASQTFSVAAGTAAEHATRKDQVGVANSALVATALNAAGTAPIYACRAWVNFNGTGVVAIRASGNVSSITDNAVGSYTVNFTTAMGDANYSGIATAETNAGVTNVHIATVPLEGINTTTMSVLTFRIDSSLEDARYVGVSVFR